MHARPPACMPAHFRRGSISARSLSSMQSFACRGVACRGAVRCVLPAAVLHVCVHQRWIHIGAIAELNFEILQHQCIFSWTDHAFYSNVQAYFWLPILTAALLAMVYGGMVLVHQYAPQYRRLTPQRRGELLKRLRQRVIALGCCLFNLMCVQATQTCCQGGYSFFMRALASSASCTRLWANGPETGTLKTTSSCAPFARSQ